MSVSTGGTGGISPLERYIQGQKETIGFAALEIKEGISLLKTRLQNNSGSIELMKNLRFHYRRSSTNDVRSASSMLPQ